MLEKKTRRRPPRTPKHEELKPETHEKGPPGLEPNREERTKRSQREGHKGTGGPPKDIKEEHEKKRERYRGRSK